MTHLSRWLSTVLAVCILINTIPISSFAQDSGAEELLLVEDSDQLVPSEPETEPSKPETEPSEPETEPSGTVTTSEEGLVLGSDLLSAGARSFTNPALEAFAQVLTDNGFDPSVILDEHDDGTVTLTVGENGQQVLVLLSQQDAALYQNWTISFSVSGSITIPDEFAGLGRDDTPFAGGLTSSSTITIVLANTLFKALDAGAELNNVNISWTGPSSKPILADTLVADAEEHEITMPLSSASSFSPYIGKLKKNGDTAGVITLPALTYSTSDNPVLYPGHAGLACGEMEPGTKLKLTALTAPAITLKSSADAGSLVGHMGAGAELEISEPLELIATLDGGNIGGLVGSMAENALLKISDKVVLATTAASGSTNGGGLVGSVTNGTIQLDADVELTADIASNGSVTGAAGGIAGAAVTTTGPLAGTGKVSLGSVTAYGTENAGVLYGDCTVSGAFSPLSQVTLADTAAYTVKGASSGGVFGTLKLEGDGRCELIGSNTLHTAFPAGTTKFGGVVGTLTGQRKNALVIDNFTVSSEFTGQQDNNRTSYPTYFGGIAAKQEDNVTLDVTSTKVSLKNPKITGSADDYDAKNHAYAGLTAYVSDGALLMAENVTVEIDSFDETNRGGGGVAGYTGKGSIVYLKGELDLTSCLLTTNKAFGQIVGKQECSLIYGPGVSISRYSNGLQLDDIGNYGELYRLDNFLTIDTDYQHSFSRQLSGSPYTLSDATDYACLALAWQSRGAFATVSGTWSDIKTSTIQLVGDIDLTGTGIGGLSRDVASDDDTFSGSLMGGGTIILDIGEANSANGVTKGDGRIYWHNAPGLFAGLSGGATVENLTLDGSIRVSNEKTSPMYCGALAARLNCSTADGIPLGTGVTTAAEIDVLCTGTNTLYVGGLIGNAYGTTATTLNLDSPQAATITSTTSGNSNHFGGVIGAIEKNTPLSINCQPGTKLGGSITIKNANDTLYAGALLGTAFPDAAAAGKRTITLGGVTVDGFTLSSSTSTRMSGILGGIWGNTDVVMDGLTVTNTQLNASGTAKLGGLVYRASGKWTVNSVNLSGLGINASGATALGLLVCQGGSYNEPINGSYQNVGGLYLEVPEHWNTAYQVPGDGNIQFGGGIFDEFVAYTACHGSGDYQITYSGSGIISLKTANGSVNMATGGERNTYVNRTDVGTAKQTNAYSRYYYNLPEVLALCDGGAVDTKEELLIWSVCRYAESTLRTYFTNENINGAALAGVTTIGSETGPANFDMEGLSYYPIRIVNSDITVKNADIKFYNQQIETLETETSPENKSTRSGTQHYTMHCGLFLDFVADGTTGRDYTMNVNGVSFDGTVGKVNDGSGALVCGTVAGRQQGAYTSVCNVVLGESDNEANAVTLGGIRVDSTADYRPVLIGKMGNYIGLKAHYVTATQTTEAGSSLIGDVGTSTAASVSLEFAGTIQLPYTAGVFTRATLLNSLSYQIGSATYRFKKDKGESSNATFGYELGWNGDIPVSVEYAGKQGWYDGAPSGGSDELKIRDTFAFDDCLPYVWCSPVYQRDGIYVSGMHELAVNIPSINLLDGCGTYGHPYTINADQLAVIAGFINTGSATNDWQVRVPKSGDTTYHTDADQYDVIATYDSTRGWEVGDGISDVRKHLATAYYQIDSSIELDGFKGIGVKDYPFAGVISGKDSSASVTLTGDSTGFINYSYGSVVRNLTVNLNQTLSIASSAPGMENKNGKDIRLAEPAPSSFFGGVIGCVLGGDNIIDSVTVEGGSNIEATGAYAHLVPIGGFVGAIAGGGVIFRGTCTGGISANDANHLYRNPVIGRVLGGFAFREQGCTIADNGDRNYKINTLSNPGGSLVWADSTLTVNNAEGLLILSAIVSSGAGSAESNAYAKGTARLARYDKIGEPDGEADRNLDTGIPYLLRKTGIGMVEICGSGTDGINLSFAEGATFDMSGYGNGYRGLSARYVSNAGFTGAELKPYTVVMRVKRFNGSGATVSGIDMQVKEYDDDDFHAASMGGIFNIVWTKQKGGGTADSIFAQNLTLNSCTVSLTYQDKNGETKNQADTKTFKDEDGLSCVAVGGFAGSVSDITGSSAHSMTEKTSNYLLKELHIQNTSTITGPNSAGGLIGATAMTNANITGCPGKLLANAQYAQFGPSFLNCSYSNTDVTGMLAAGGLVGDVFAQVVSTTPTFSGLGIPVTNDNAGCYATCTITRDDLTLGSDSNIRTKALGGICGGIFGGVGMRARFNNPEVDTKTGLTILNGAEPQELKLNRVSVKAESTNVTIKTSANGNNGCDTCSITAAAGCIARIGNVNPVYFHKVSMENCEIYIEDTGTGYAGGIVASGYTNTTISVYDTSMKSTSVIAQNAGGLAGTVKATASSVLNAIHCDFEDCKVYGRNAAGGIVGYAQYNFNFFNIRFNNTSVCKISTVDAISTNTQYTGRLIGQPANLMLSAAGISVVSTADGAVIPAWDVGSGTSGKATTQYGTGGYVAYADYSGLVNPAYNPQFSLKTGENTAKLLTGDAVGKIENDTYGSVAARILADHKADAQGQKNLAPYPSGASAPYEKNAAAAIAATEWAPQISTFQQAQGYTDTQWPYEDLPVLLLKGKASGRDDIVRYLDVITNGAYSNAGVPKSLSVTVYSYDPATHQFGKTTDDGTHSVYVSNGQLQVRKSCFDNKRNRFSLVEVTFTVNTKEAGKTESPYTYTVSVPVMVIRELQFVYSTTFSYGTEFKPAAYENLKDHVLESTDVPFSAYLTLQYNRDQAKYSEYEWEDLINEGSDAFLKIDKILQFDNSGDPMPNGTKLTLLDCQHGNKAYYYRVANGAANIPLSSFKDSAGRPFQSSMADVLGVTLTLNDSGQFVETNQDDATVLLGGKYYRLWKESDGTDCQRFDLAVPDFSKMDKEDLPKENYLLVMEVPDQGENFSLNGQLHMGLSDVIASTGTPLHRYNGSNLPKPGENDEFTYLIFSGYRQTLESLNVQRTYHLPQNPVEGDPVMRFHLKDTITFSNEQVYNLQDHLYLKFMATLRQNETEDCQFPAGTSGTVHFYVQNEAGQYFTLGSDGSWNTVPVDSKTEAVSYLWTSQGDNMELRLSRDGTDAKLLDLAAVRQAVKGGEGDSSLIVTAEMVVDFSKLSEKAFEDTIPASDNNGTDNYVQLYYQAQLSTQSASLSYSNAKAVKEDPAKYYRAVKYQAILSMDAREINQLGVNPLAPEPQYLSNDKKTSQIDLTALLDLGDLENPNEVLSNTQSITFKLYLERREDTNGKLDYKPVPNSSDFISFDGWSYQDNCWSWEIQQDQFYQDGQAVISKLFDGERFSMDITAHVSMLPRNYANYKIRLEATFTGSTPAINSDEAYVVYTYACIDPSFYEPLGG